MAVEMPWSQTSDQMLAVLWSRVKAQAVQAGVTIPPKFVSVDPPKEFTKMAYFTRVLKALIEEDPSKYMTKRKSSVQYLEGVLASKLGWKKSSEVSALKQNAMLTIPLRPAWTHIAQNFTATQLITEANAVRAAMRQSPGWGKSTLKDEFTKDPWPLSAHGMVNSLFIVGHADTVAGNQIMPWSSTKAGQIEDLPMPARYYEQGAQTWREKINLDGRFLKHAHLLIGSPSAGGKCRNGTGIVTVSNGAGAPGMPYPLIKDARSLTSDGNRPNKANVAQRETEHILAWLKAGCPWTGPTYDRLAQPNTMWKRGDAKVDIELAAFCQAMLNQGFPLASLLLPGRGIVIVSTALTFLELVAFKPFQEHLNDSDVQSIDLRTRRFTKTIMKGFIQAVLTGRMRAVGADVARWDLNAYPGEHGVMAAFTASWFAPGEHEMLVGCATRPALWTEDQINDTNRSLLAGDSMYVSVEVPNVSNEGTHIEKVQVHKVVVNIRELIIKTFQMVHGSGVHMVGYDLPVKIRKVLVPSEILNQSDVGSPSKDYVIFVHGCIRSGSGGTSANNSNLNGIGYSGAGDYLDKANLRKGLAAARLQWYKLPALKSIEGSQSEDKELIRGDDSVRLTAKKAVTLEGQEVNADVIASATYAIFGRYGNVEKQRTGDYGRPDVEFASENYDEFFPGGITSIERSTMRTLTVEAHASQEETSPTLDHEFQRDRFNLGLITSTMETKSRMAPQRGANSSASPMGNPTPGNEHFIRFIAGLDKFGLVYGTQDMTSEELQNMISSEAIRWARREARKHNLEDEVIDELVEEWMQSELHAVLHRMWEERKEPSGRAKGAAEDSFEGMIRTLENQGESTN